MGWARIQHLTTPETAAAHYATAGETLLKNGAPLLAYDTLADGLRSFPADIRLRQLVALALARSGASRRANEMLTDLAREGHADEETLGLLARTHKDLAADAPDDRSRLDHLARAFACYRDAYRLSRGYYSGINAAALALLLGKPDEASSLARAVREQCLRRLDPGPDHTGHGDDYWILATLGEAALLQREWRQAEDWYARAVAIGRERLGDLVSTRRNARLIVEHLGADASPIERLFHVPRVVVFTGHLIDRPQRPVPRFPPALEGAVRDAIRERLRAADVGVGYASAACGGDILFLESLAELGAERRIVLPYERDRFRRDSVDFLAESDWAARFEHALDGATEVMTASDQRVPGSLSYEYGSRVLDGAARGRADELETGLHRLAVWDGQPGDGAGGTAWSVERWRAAGHEPDVIDLSEILRRERGEIRIAPAPWPPAGDRTKAAASSGFRTQIVGLLFADAKGFSKLTEDEVPLFVEHFLGTVAGELSRSSRPPILVNTWGDGLYFVFPDVRDTGVFALDLCDAIRSVDWKERGFRGELALRIGLHAGPAYECIDPVTTRPTYIGAHVSRAARIEPITPPGEVYASGAFVALARAEDVREFRCSYVGQTPLAKGYGTFPTYVVHRRH